MPVHLQSGDAITASYQIRTSNFTATPRSSYAVDTSGGSFDITLPANPVEGDAILFADARRTWNNHPPVFLRNGNKIEGSDANLTNSAQGTFFTAVYLDAATGWRILESDTPPQNLAIPLIFGETVVGAMLTNNAGNWTGTPTSYTYQWQKTFNAGTTWENISGAVSATYTIADSDEGGAIRVRVVANNSNGSSGAIYSESSGTIGVPIFPVGVVAFWRLDSLNDSSENSYNLTNNNNVAFVPGKLGNAASCTGGSYFTSQATIGPGAFTVSCWFKTSQSGSSNRFMSGNESFGGNYFFLMEHGGRVYANWRGASQIGPNPNNINDNQWHHTALSWDTEMLRLYVDGQFASQASNSGGAQAVTVSIGAGSAGQFNFMGLIDAFGVWDRALTLQEIQLVYNNGSGVEI